MSKYDVIVLGSGPGGYVTAIRASQLGLKTAVIEKESLGGVCLNWGCIPTKALLKSAQVFEYLKHAKDYGLTIKEFDKDFDAVVKRSRDVAEGMSKGVQFLMKKNKIDVISGYGTLKTGKKVDFSMSNYGGIRAAITKGNVTVSNAFELMPFDNTLVVVELNYEKIQELFSYFISKKMAHPLSSHIELKIKNKSYNVLINGKSIDKDKTYFVATSNYLQKGGDAMNFFKNPLSLYDSNFLIRDAIVEYFKSKDTLISNLDNRVIISN